MKKIISLFAFLMLLNCAFALDFEYNNKKLEYNVDTLKFSSNGKILTTQEVKDIFPEYEVILISQFDNDKKYKMKNSLFKSKKVLLLNDTKRTFHLFEISPSASRYEQNNEIKSLITIYGKKNVRLKHQGGDEFEIVVK